MGRTGARAAVLGAIVGAAAGAFVTWSLTGGGPRHLPPGAGPPATAPLVTPSGHRAAVAAPPATPAPTDGPNALRACRAALAAAEAHAAGATRESKTIQSRLQAAQAVVTQEEGHVIPRPAGVSDLFTDPGKARQAFRAVLDDVGAGEVTAVDCTEFPCIVYGRLPQDDATALRRAVGRATGWRPCASSQGARTADATPTIHFGYALCPPDLATHLTPADNTRLRYRMREMWHAGMP